MKAGGVGIASWPQLEMTQLQYGGEHTKGVSIVTSRRQGLRKLETRV